MAKEKRGKIVVLDGLDGCGKGVQLEKLKQRLPEAVFTREPGGTDFGVCLRNILLDRSLQVSARTELMLFFADRSDHWEKVVIPSIEKGQLVVSDRADAASFAFQVAAGKPDKDLRDIFWNLRYEVYGDYAPDLYVLLDVSAEECQRRLALAAEAQQREITGFDARAFEFHLAVREGYLEFEKHLPDRFIRINGLRSVEDVHKELWSALATRKLVPA